MEHITYFKTSNQSFGKRAELEFDFPTDNAARNGFSMKDYLVKFAGHNIGIGSITK